MKRTLSILFIAALLLNFKLIIHPSHNHYIICGRYIDTAVVYSDGDMCAWFGSRCYTRLGEISQFNYNNQ